MKRGFYGIAFFEPKFEENIGTAIRSAKCFNADFIALIGKRFAKQATDTTATERHIPVYEYKNLKDFMEHIPLKTQVISVEVDGARELESYKHPERAIYVFGGEDRTLPDITEERIKIKTVHCLNMAVTASIIMYDRQMKSL